MPEIVNNKEGMPYEYYRARYEKEDPAGMSERTGCPWDPEAGCFTVTFIGTRYLVSWPEFEIRIMDTTRGADPAGGSLTVKILFLRYLMECVTVESTGKYLTFREIPKAQVYDRQFHGRCIGRLAGSWGKRPEEFSRRMLALGAAALDQSDVGFEAELFPGFSMQFLLWTPDDEFPASAQILFSDNFAAAFHGEDLVVASETFLNILKKM